MVVAAWCEPPDRRESRTHRPEKTSLFLHASPHWTDEAGPRAGKETRHIPGRFEDEGELFAHGTLPLYACLRPRQNEWLDRKLRQASKTIRSRFPRREGR
jgi:hypothetical protein